MPNSLNIHRSPGYDVSYAKLSIGWESVTIYFPTVWTDAELRKWIKAIAVDIREVAADGG